MILPSISITRICNSSRYPPAADAYPEVPGRGATLTHLNPGRYSRSAYSPRTDSTETAVEFVSATLSAAAKDMLSLSKPIYKRRSIPLDAIAALLVP